MAVEAVSDLIQITLDIKGENKKYDCNMSETHYLALENNVETMRTKVKKLAALRARFLPPDYRVHSAPATHWAQKNQTFQCLDTPILAAYPPTARKDLSVANTTLPVGANGTVPDGVDNTLVTFSEADWALVNTPENSTWFRFEGEGYAHCERYYNGIPDKWISDYDPVNLTTSIVWVDTATTPAEPAVQVSDGTYWNNYKAYMTYLKLYFSLVTMNPGTDEKPKKTFPYRLHPIQRIIFRGLTRREPGKPKNGPRGRAKIAS